MNNKKIERVWILNHHAKGNGGRHDELARHLNKLGVKVVIIASSFNNSTHEYKYKEKYLVKEINDKLTYVWLRTSPKYFGNGIKRILNMISYMFMAKRRSKELFKLYGKPDAVIGSSVHPFAWEAAYSIAKKANADFYAEVRDLWPLSLVEVQGINEKHPLVKFFGILEKRAYKRSKKIITTMPYAYKFIMEKYGYPRNKIEWIANGIDTNVIDEALNNKDNILPDKLDAYLQNNWCAVYTGSFVKSECVDFILEAADVLKKRNENIKFAIVGSGHMKSKLLEMKKEKYLDNVEIFDRVTKNQVALIVKKAKVCLAAVRNLDIYRYGLSMNKMNDYLYSGNPTIFACNYKNVVEESGGGISLDFGNAQAYADAIENIYNMKEEERNKMGEKGKEIIKKQYDTSILAQKLLSIIEDK